MKFASERRCGLECGATSAKMVMLVRHNDAFQVENVFIEEVLFESRIKGKVRWPIDITRQLLIHKNLSGYKAIFVATGAMESCFIILPKMSKAETDSAMLLQAKKIVFSEIENPIISAIGSEFLRNRMGYLVGLADGNAVNAWCRLIEGSGSSIDNVTLGACAYQALAHYQRWADEFPVFLVADLGTTASNFYILDRQAVKFMRKVPVGGDAITKAMTTEVSFDGRSIQLTDIEAEEMKITAYLSMDGKKEPDGGRQMTDDGGQATDLSRVARDASQFAPKRIEQMEVLARPVIERISSEIMRSVQFFKDNVGQKVEAVFLTGGTAGLQILRTHIEKSVELPVRMIDPFAGMAFTNSGMRKYAEKNKGRLAIAVGLALTEQPAISLLPRSVQMLKRFAAFTFLPKLVVALMIFVFFPVLFAGTCDMIKIYSLQSSIRNYQQQLQQASQEHQRLTMLQARFQESSEYFHALQNLIGRNPLWPGVLNALADAIPPGVVLTRFAMENAPDHPDVIIIEGKIISTTVGFDNVMSSILMALSTSVFFKRVTIINAKADRIESMPGTFEIQCELAY